MKHLICLVFILPLIYFSLIPTVLLLRLFDFLHHTLPGDCRGESYPVSIRWKLPRDKYPAEGSQSQSSSLLLQAGRWQEGELPGTQGVFAPPEAIPTHSRVWAENRHCPPRRRTCVKVFLLQWTVLYTSKNYFQTTLWPTRVWI